jgi:hypothetical protein
MPSELILCGPYPRRRIRVSPRALPLAVSASLSAAYLLAAPRSPDLAAQLLRARLFGAEGPGGVWSNWWYAGHPLPGYSVLFPALGWLLTPQLAGALGAVAATAGFDALARHRLAARATMASTWFAVGASTELLSGRLTFLVGLAAALAAAAALQRRHTARALLAALLTGLLSPVAAVFAALSGAAAMASPGLAAAGAGTAAAAATPLLLTVLLVGPTPGREPFALSALVPLPILAAALLAAVRRQDRTLRAGLILYTAGCLLDYAIPNPLGGNAARLAALAAGPLAALLIGNRRALILLALPLLYLQWQGAIRDVAQAQGDPSTTAAYYQPLLRYLTSRPGPPFRVEIPFTRDHWESYEVAPEIALARGWERQLDIAENPLFYGQDLTPGRYEALADAPLDPSAQREAALIRRGLPDLPLVRRTAHWRIYAVRRPTAIVTGAAELVAMGPDWLRLRATRPGTALIRVRYSPLWDGGALSRAGAFISLRVRRPAMILLRAELP